MSLIKNLDHVAVTVSDLDSSLHFYTNLLGFEEVERHRLEGQTISAMAGKSNVIMQVVRLATPETPNILLDLQLYIEPPGGVSNAELGMANHAHLCYSVSDLEAAHKDLTQKGVEFVSEPVIFDLGEQWDYGALKVVFLKDPDGFIIELIELPKKKE